MCTHEVIRHNLLCLVCVIVSCLYMSLLATTVLPLQQVEVDGTQCMLEILDTAGTVSLGEIERGGQGEWVGSADLQCLSHTS